MKKLVIISIICAMFTMTSCGVEPAEPVTSVSSFESESLSVEKIETTAISKEKIKTENASTSTTINITTAVISTENSTRKEVNMETETIKTIDTAPIETEVSDTNIENISEELLNKKNYEEIQEQKYEEFIGTISSEPFESLVTKIVSDDILTNYLGYHMIPILSNTVTPLEINEIYGIELIRDMGNGKMYAVQKLESGAYFYTFYKDTALNCTALISKSLTKGDFETVKIGSLISDVENIEPATVYWKNIITSRINSEFNGDFTQTVLLKDALLLISYERQNNDYYVSDMIYYDDFKETREYGAYDYTILPEDYPN